MREAKTWKPGVSHKLTKYQKVKITWLLIHLYNTEQKSSSDIRVLKDTCSAPHYLHNWKG